MKTKITKASVKDFIASVKNETRRKDAQLVVKMMRKASGKTAKMWGPSIIGFDIHRYKYANGSDGEICMIGFSPRASALAFYMTTKFTGAAALLKKLGKHKFGAGGCMYINKLADVDLGVLQEIVNKSHQHNKDKQDS